MVVPDTGLSQTRQSEPGRTPDDRPPDDTKSAATRRPRRGTVRVLTGGNPAAGEQVGAPERVGPPVRAGHTGNDGRSPLRGTAAGTRGRLRIARPGNGSR